MGLEWVWGLLQPGFVRWAPPPPASQNHFNHWYYWTRMYIKWPALAQVCALRVPLVPGKELLYMSCIANTNLHLIIASYYNALSTRFFNSRCVLNVYCRRLCTWLNVFCRQWKKRFARIDGHVRRAHNVMLDWAYTLAHKHNRKLLSVVDRLRKRLEIFLSPVSRNTIFIWHFLSVCSSRCGIVLLKTNA